MIIEFYKIQSGNNPKSTKYPAKKKIMRIGKVTIDFILLYYPKTMKSKWMTIICKLRTIDQPKSVKGCYLKILQAIEHV